MAKLLPGKISGLYVAGLFYFNHIPLWVDLTTKLLSRSATLLASIKCLLTCHSPSGWDKTNVYKKKVSNGKEPMHVICISEVPTDNFILKKIHMVMGYTMNTLAGPLC